MQEIKHVLDVLKEVEKAIISEDIIKLKDLSNQTIHTASISQDTDNILVAVLIYSISKVIERSNYREYPEWKSFVKSIKTHIDHAINFLENEDINKFRFEFKKLRKSITKLSGNFKFHVQDVFRKAEINKASRIYEHGISMEQTAKILGITIWELSEYAGTTGISNVNLNRTMSEKKRIQIAMEIFEK